jgi:hypothetical protein
MKKDLIAVLKMVSESSTSSPKLHWLDEVDDDDLTDAIDHINLQRNRFMEKGVGELESVDSGIMVAPEKLLPASAFEGKDKGWLLDLPKDEWAGALRKTHERDFTQLLEQATTGLTDVIVIEDELCDGYGRSFLAYGLGEDVSATYYEEKK